MCHVHKHAEREQCAENTITATLRSTVPFYSSCLASFTISGLFGAHATQSPSGAIALAVSDDAVLNTTALWNQSSGQIVVFLTEGDGNPMVPEVCAVCTLSTTTICAKSCLPDLLPKLSLIVC